MLLSWCMVMWMRSGGIVLLIISKCIPCPRACTPIYIHVYAYIYTCVRLYIYTCTPMYIKYIQSHTQMHTLYISHQRAFLVHARVRLCVSHIYEHKHTHIFIFIYTRAYTHTYVYIYKHVYIVWITSKCIPRPRACTHMCITCIPSRTQIHTYDTYIYTYETTSVR